MAQDKELLLKDLCARLPYGVICRYKNENRPLFCISPTQYYKIALDNAINVKHNGVKNCVIEEVKPYLFPLSSMTEEQNDSWRDAFMNDLAMSASINYPESEKYLAVSHAKSLEWLYKNHFDVNGLIEKGLAIDATTLNIY